MTASSTPDPCLIVIFGASGDLTHRKLLPSLYDLYVGGQLPEQFAVLGVSRTEFSDARFRDHLRGSAKKFAACYDTDGWGHFASHVHYHQADSTQAEAFGPLKQRMCDVAAEHDTGANLLFYLSLAPHLYDPVIVNIGSAGLVTEGKRWCSIDREHLPWQRIVVEKPFGSDVESAAHLNRVLGRVFEEESIYRIDHYLGKETVQNLMVFRFANAIFEPVWNRQYIDHVQITAAETVGVESRGSYYDSPSGGALRDMIQSHLLQVMAVVAMEPPVAMAADDIRIEKAKVLRAVRPPDLSMLPEVAVRGQYGPGQINGQSVPGYRQEKDVAADSQTDTYAALQLEIDTWRWSGVPFYLRSGKRMAKKTTEIVVNFRGSPHCLFRDRTHGQECLPANQIVINVQPNEGIRLRFEGKVPGLALGSLPEPGADIRSVVMDFDYVKEFHVAPPEAYSTLLADALRGDQSHFKHRDEIEHAWRVVQPVLDHWAEHPQDDLPNYAAGSWGPAAADEMLARGARQWHNG